MNERQLKSFLLAADQGSFTKAAAIAHISVPSFIQQINSFENSTGYRLFDRNARGITLTEYGRVLYESSGRILQIYEDALGRCERLKAESRHAIRITYPVDSFPPYIMEAYRSFSVDHPGINITFAPAETFTDNFRMILEGSADLALIAEPNEEWQNGIDFLAFRDDRVSFCMAPDDPLARKKRLEASDLKGRQILCAHYPYLKCPFEESLKDIGAELISLSGELDMTGRAELLRSHMLFPIYGSWGVTFDRSLKVVPSSVVAGKMGVICLHTEDLNSEIREFTECVRSFACGAE